MGVLLGKGRTSRGHVSRTLTKEYRVGSYLSSDKLKAVDGMSCKDAPASSDCVRHQTSACARLPTSQTASVGIQGRRQCTHTSFCFGVLSVVVFWRESAPVPKATWNMLMLTSFAFNANAVGFSNCRASQRCVIGSSWANSSTSDVCRIVRFS